MSKRREQRINELIQQELGKIIHKELNLEKDILVTVSRVKVSGTLENAKVWISVYPFKEREYILKELNKKIGLIQHRLNKIIRMRFVPKIFFGIDEAEEKAAKLEEIK